MGADFDKLSTTRRSPQVASLDQNIEPRLTVSPPGTVGPRHRGGAYLVSGRHHEGRPGQCSSSTTTGFGGTTTLLGGRRGAALALLPVARRLRHLSSASTLDVGRDGTSIFVRPGELVHVLCAFLVSITGQAGLPEDTAGVGIRSARGRGLVVGNCQGSSEGSCGGGQSRGPRLHGQHFDV